MSEQEKLEQENEQIMRSLYQAYLSHDIATVIDTCAADSEWFAMGPPDALPYAGSYRGRSEVEKYIAILDDVEESNHVMAQEFIARGDKVIVLDRGRVIQFDDPDTVFERPASARVARFLNCYNLFDGACDGPAVPSAAEYAASPPRTTSA